jgi:WD40 repeat protein
MLKGSPFKFLDSFTKEDKEIFFGRDKEVEEIYSRVFQGKMLLVYGASGTGKTSLIQCGLANKFNDADWLPLIIRRGTNITSAIHAQLNNLAVTPLKQGVSLKKAVQSLYLDYFKPIYLIFDQFEELFIFGTQDEIKSFVNEVSSIVKSDLQCKLIFVIRGEYLEHLTVFEDELPEFFDNRIRIEKMTRANASEAITGPCSKAGIYVENGFAANLLDKLNPDKAEVELTYLQVFLDKLYKKVTEKNTTEPSFNNNLLDQLGNVSDILSDFLEEQLSKMADPDSAVTVLKSFVSVEGTRKPMGLEEIIDFTRSLGKDISLDKTKSLVNQFVDLRILKDKDENDKYELRHDALAFKIFEKITIVEKELIEVRLLIENAYKNYQRRKVLINETDIAYIAPYENKLFLNEQLKQFVEESKRQVNRKRRRTRNILISAASVIIIVLSGFTLWAMHERSVAEGQTQEAEKQKILAEQQSKIAEQQKNEAVQANKLALDEKARAEANAKSAIAAKQQAELSKQQALSSETIAEKEKANALTQSELAKKEAQEAEEGRKAAKKAESLANEAEIKAEKNYVLSTAHIVGLKALLFKNDPQLQGLLALQSFKSNQEYQGNNPDPVIFDALRSSYINLGANKNSSLNIASGHTALYENKGRVSYYDGYTVVTRDVFKSKPVTFSNAYIPIGRKVDKISFSPDGSVLVSSLDNYEVILYKVNVDTSYSGKPVSSNLIAELLGHKAPVRGLAFSIDMTHLATGGKDSLIKIWKLSGKDVSLETTLQSPSGIKSLTYSNDGSIIYSLQEDGKIMVWDTKTHSSSQMSYQGSVPVAFALNRSNNTLILGLTNGSLCLADLKTGKQNIINAHNAQVDLIVFNNDYSLMATSGSDKTVDIFNTANIESLPPVTIKDIHAKTRNMVFTSVDRLVIVSDKNMYFIITSEDVMANEIEKLLKRNLNKDEWDKYFKDIKYEKTVRNLPAGKQ